MKTWTTPVLREMDVRLTAKDPGTVEQYPEELPGGAWTMGTYNSATHECINGWICPIEKKDVPGS